MGTGGVKFNGAAVVGSKVYFVPYGHDNVGVLDTVTNIFSTIATGLTGGLFKFNGAAVVGSKVYFSPEDEDNVGFLDTVTNRFSTIATGLTGDDKFSGAI